MKKTLLPSGETLTSALDRTETLPLPANGEKTKYTPDFARLAYNAALLGMKQAAFAKLLGVNPVTLTRWHNEFPEFHDAWLKGGPLANAEVARASFLCATGQFEHEETALLRDGTTKTYKKKLEPNIKAQSLWLGQKEGWSERTRVESVSANFNIDTSDPQKAADAYYALMRGRSPDEDENG